MQSPSEQFGDFVQQLPLGPFITVCGATLALMFFVFWIGYLKPRRRQAKEANTPAQDTMLAGVGNDTNTTTPTVNEYHALSENMNQSPQSPEMDDLPDLNALLDTSSLIKDLPPVEPASPQNKNPSAKPQSPTPSAPNPPVPTMRQQGEQIIQLHTGQRIAAEEIVAVLRDPRDGRLVVQIDDVGYRSLVDSVEAKQKFVQIMRELSTVVTEPDENPPEIEIPTPEKPPMAAPVDKPTGENPIIAMPPPSTPDGAMPGDLPTYKLEESVQPQRGGIFGGRPKYEPQPIPELDIAAAIEAYLQHRLSYTPEYAEREIHVYSAPGGGVRIQVDDAFYEAVGDVADPDIKAFLAETIQEWQDRQ